MRSALTPTNPQLSTNVAKPQGCHISGPKLRESDVSVRTDGRRWPMRCSSPNAPLTMRPWHAWMERDVCVSVRVIVFGPWSEEGYAWLPIKK